MDEIIWTGAPGAQRRNNTSAVAYQLVCALINTCGFCLPYHLAIAPWWGIPFHRGCRCRQVPVFPGRAAAHPFADFRAILHEMSADDRAAVVGKNLYRLLEAGLVRWDEIVGPGGVRSLAEVVADRAIPLERLVRAGVQPGVAARAIDAASSGAAAAAAARRSQLVFDAAGAFAAQRRLFGQLTRNVRPAVPATGLAMMGAVLGAALLMDAKRRKIRATLNADGSITLERLGERTVVRPGASALGETYEYWLRIAREPK